MGAVLWIACLQFFLAEQVVRSHWTLTYSFARNYVSDLGATGCSTLVCSPWHTLMNGSFVLQGLLITGGAILTYRRWNFPGRMRMWLLMISGLGVAVVGFAPEDVNSGLHRPGAALHFLAGGLGITAVGLSVRRGFGWLSMAASVAVLTATITLTQQSKAWVREMGVGVLERVAAYGIAGWMVVAGAWLFWQINSRSEVEARR